MSTTTPDSTSDQRPPALTAGEALAALGRIRLDDGPLESVMARIGELARDSTPGADEVSVTLVEGGRARTVAFTSDLAVQLDERQYRRSFGPCTDAASTGQNILIADTESAASYQDFAAVARRAGVRCVLSVTMPTSSATTGSINLYARSPDAYDDAAIEIATAFADHAAVALVNAALLDSQASLARQMQEAMATRAVIEQAKGILMARLGCSAEEAFATLVAESQRTNRKLNVLASELTRSSSPRPARS